MNDFFKTVCVCIVIALVINIINNILESCFLNSFLTNQLIVIQLSIMAITIATYSFIITKLEELSLNNPGCFKKTYDALKTTILEQLTCIILTTMLLIIKESRLLVKMEICWFSFVVNTCISSVIIYAINILRDVGMAVFVLIDAFASLKKNNKDLNK